MNLMNQLELTTILHCTHTRQTTILENESLFLLLFQDGTHKRKLQQCKRTIQAKLRM